jgi:hypothetical protein
VKPIEFKGQNTILGIVQEEYMNLPALRCDDTTGTVWSCWELDDYDIADLIKHRKLWVGQFTFKNKFVPQLLSSVMPGEVSMAMYKCKQEE